MTKAQTVDPRWLAWSLTPLIMSALLVCHPAKAATFSAKDSDAIGVWAGDIKNPGSRYEIVAGARDGELQLIPPSTQKMDPIALHRISPNRFVSTQGVQPDASLILTSERRARLRVHSSTKTGISFTYLLVDKQ